MMNACRCPRSPSVGWRGCWSSGSTPSSSALHLLPHSNFKLPVWNFNLSVSRGLSSCFPGGAGAKPVPTTFCQRNAHARQQKSRTIILSIFGGNNCKLCAKAALWVQRVLVSLPNATSSYANSVLVGGGQRFDQVPTSLASASLDFTDSARSRGCPAGAGRGSTHGDEGVLPHVNFSGGTGDVAHRFALETAGPRQSSCDTEEGCLLHSSVVHQPARSVVAVEVQQFNLDCVETRQQLDLTEAEARALRENIPVVFVNGKQVSRLRFNGAAVRSALSEELERLGSSQ